MTDTFVATETASVYIYPNNAKGYYVRLQAGESAQVVRYVDSIWLIGTAKGSTGYIERKRGNIIPGVDVPPPPPTPQTNLIYIKGYFEAFGMDYVTRRGIELHAEEVYANIYGLPAAIKMFNTKQIDIRPDTITRELWLEIFSSHAFGLTKDTINKRFVGLLKNGVCYTDHAGNVGFNQIITANNIAYSMGNPEVKPGNKWPPDNLWRPIRCLKVGSLNSMRDQIAKYPHIVSNATISNQGYEGRGVDPFWHLDGRDVKVPQFCADEYNWIPEIFVQPIPDGEEPPNSYYPAR